MVSFSFQSFSFTWTNALLAWKDVNILKEKNILSAKTPGKIFGSIFKGYWVVVTACECNWGMPYIQVLVNPILHLNFKTSVDNIWAAARMSSTVCLLVLTCDTSGCNSCFRILRDVGKGGGKESRARKCIHRFLTFVEAIKVKP